MTIETKGINEAEERMRAIKRGISKTQFQAMSRAAKHAERAVKTDLRTGKHGLTSKRTLRQSINSAAFVQKRDVVGLVGSPLVYARIHELGTVGKGGELPDIKPKRAKALTVPMPGTQKNARASDYPDAFIFTSASGKKFLARRQGDSLDVLFVLKDKVALKPTHYLSRSVKGEEEAIVGILAKQVESVVRSGGA